MKDGRSRDWYEITKTHWQQPAGSSGGQSSFDAWDHAKPKGKWKEVTEEFDAPKESVKERKTPGTRVAGRARSGKPNSSQRPKVRQQTRIKEKEMVATSKTSSWKFRKREEEDEARCFIEEMQRNLDAAENKSFEAREKLHSILSEYIEAFHKERGRPKTIMTEMWQLMQSHDTKDLEEILSKIKLTRGGSEAARARRFWAQDEDEDQ